MLLFAGGYDVGLLPRVMPLNMPVSSGMPSCWCSPASGCPCLDDPVWFMRTLAAFLG